MQKNYLLALLLVFLINSVWANSATDDSEIKSQYDKLDNKFPQNLDHLEIRQIQNVFFKTTYHPIARLDNVHKYDDEYGRIGFCFGRAMAAYFEARKIGLKPSSIKKLFIIGDMRENGKTVWRFHVTTIVKGPNDQFFAVDPILSTPVLTIPQWTSKVQSFWDENKKSHFYITSGDAVMPDIRSFPSPDKEMGENIIELKFNPEIRPSIFKSVLHHKFYYLNLNDEKKFFSSAVEDDGRFDFTGLTVNTEKYDYRNYFADLLFHYDRDPSIPVEPESFELAKSLYSGAVTAAHQIARPNLYSPKLHLLGQPTQNDKGESESESESKE